ncbi:MAG: DUF488 domain-containing protein [Defluviicoccus sp.]|nr:DUF488 domain-containing protein [Defluviicoccus sp.]MDE0278810.1 DUF488 domain-containing protein [Defluviicoccus sp.]
MARKDALFTIGHSNHALDAFLQLLRAHGVSAVADVRSVPYSRYCPHFSKDPLSRSLGDARMKYVFLGRELGGRSDDPSCYENGRIRYSRLSRRPEFRDGIERLKKGAGEHKIAVMCAEREPLECHRTILVAPALEEEGLSVAHIHADGRLEAHDEAMDRLLDLVKLPRDDFFRSREEIVAEALLRQEERVAYRTDGVDAEETP